MRVCTTVLSLGLLAGLVTPAIRAASTLYTQPFNTTNAYLSDSSHVTLYDNFTLPTAGTVTSFSWDGIYSSGQLTSFTLGFYGDNSGAPGTLLASDDVTATYSDTGSQVYGYDIFQYSATLSPLTLSAGTQYWVSVVGNVGLDFDWETGDGGDSQTYSYTSGGGLQPSSGYDYAFTLVGSQAPEPSSLALLGTGLVGLGVQIRRRQTA